MRDVCDLANSKGRKNQNDTKMHIICFFEKLIQRAKGAKRKMISKMDNSWMM